MTETTEKSPKGRTKTYKFAQGERKDSAIKAYFDQVSSKALKDPFVKFYRTEGGVDIIKPPLNPYALVKLIQDNSFLNQAIDAMVTNVHGFGYRMEYVGKDKEGETSPEMVSELENLEEFFTQPNTYQSFSDLREKLAWDYYVFGNAYIEVTRDDKNRVITIHHLPAPTVRITKIEPVDVPVTEYLKRQGKTLVIKTKKQFRRYIQIDEMGRKVWYKEFGDPRTIDGQTGKENASLAFENSATEVLHYTRYNGQSVYGIPTWYSQLPSIVGSRQAELTNLDFFENNGIPALAVLVSGGYLTEEAFDQLVSNFDSVKGRGSQNKVLVLEARGAIEDSSNTGAIPTPSITMKPLYSDRQSDALFQEYEKAARNKIRSSFRLPPVFLGDVEQTTFASAKVSLEIAENQIFIPERNKFDDLVNNKILSTWGDLNFSFRTHPASLVSAEDLLNAVGVFNDAGAMTPNIAIGMLNEKLNLDIPRIDEFWGDLPYKTVESIMQAQGGPDKTNFMVDAFQAMVLTDVSQLKKVPVPKPAKKVTASEESQDEE